jgi:hypothetical protein
MEIVLCPLCLESINMVDYPEHQNTHYRSIHCQSCRAKIEAENDTELKKCYGQINTLMCENAELKERLDNAKAETRQKCWEDVWSDYFDVPEIQKLKQKWGVK